MGRPILACGLLAALGAAACGGSNGSTTSGSGGNAGSRATGGDAGTGATGGSGATGGVTAGDGSLVLYGDPYTGGQYNLGPVDYAETQWHNACAPATKYPASVASEEGDLLAGLWNGIPNVAASCDACISVTTAMGKTALLRVVTYGDTTTNSIDVSPQAYAILNNGEYPRSMTWQFAKCPATGVINYEFQTGSSEYWTSLWVRNARVPLTQIEVKSPNHPSFVALTRASDGTVTDASGFGAGTFTIRLTGMDGQQISDTFGWPAGGIAGQMLDGQANFP